MHSLSEMATMPATTMSGSGGHEMISGGTFSNCGSSTSSVGHLGADGGSFVPTSSQDEAMDELGPVSRDRCNTWPMRRPNLDINAQTSPLIHEEIPEEENDLYDSSEHIGRLGGSSTNSNGVLHSPDANSTYSEVSSPVMNGVSPTESNEVSSNSKKSTTRRNAWGNMSYADLITQAILQSPDKRLTLSQVYEWMVQNVPYFRDKGDSNRRRASLPIIHCLSSTRPQRRRFFFVALNRSVLSLLHHYCWPTFLRSSFAHTSLVIRSQLCSTFFLAVCFSLPIFLISPLPAATMEASSSVDDDFVPEPRERCYTWPMQQFVYDQPPPQMMTSPMMREPTVGQMLTSTPSSSNMGAHLMPLGMHMVPGGSHGVNMNNPMSGGSAGGGPIPKKKRCRKKPTDQLAQKKPNPWGEDSYSDIIAKALESAPDGRLKLNEIYQWFSDNIPYFRDRSSQEEAAGWKNSIRHNLSLHSRFMRIQNEGAGKSSWWVINPDAKPGRNPRRRERATTIDVTNKAALDKSRGRARKKIKDLRCGQIIGSVNCMAGSQASIVSHDLYDEESMQGNFEPVFRPRTQSNLSVPGSSARVSPSMEQPFDDLDFPPWVDTASNMAIPNDIVDRTDQMRIDAARCGIGNNGNMNAYAQQQHQMQQIKQEPKIIKQENGAPPSYHELNSVRGPCAQNPLLRTQMTPPGKYQPMNMYQAYGNWGAAGVPVSAHACGVQQQSQSLGSALPIDLENLTLPDQPLMDVDMDVESLLRHELSQTRDHQLNFDL
ncbi:unnamed protein product [Caenorhabditis auriculariae]|uniref:Forkhead box protein O n=1 Tax=Caenorhabditis auriculariae TaxID=2777116 RepID=A0A8S1GMB7_9PELO|nr:unnamed protein product [Caenorhabditis auriculariae]